MAEKSVVLWLVTCPVCGLRIFEGHIPKGDPVIARCGNCKSLIEISSYPHAVPRVLSEWEEEVKIL